MEIIRATFGVTKPMKGTMIDTLVLDVDFVHQREGAKYKVDDQNPGESLAQPLLLFILS